MKRLLFSPVPAVAASLAILTGIGVSLAFGADQVPIGPRAIAMGNAFTAIADDASSIFWNPAGLPRIGNEEIAATHADLFGTGIKDDDLAFVLPLSPSLACAVDWYHTGFDDGELGYGHNRIDLAGGLKITERFSLGLNGKYLSRDTRLDDVSVRKGSGFGFDAGVLYAPIDRLRLGANLQDMFDTELDYSGGSVSSVVYRRNLRVGLAVQPIRNGLLAMDIDDRLHLGAEFQPLNGAALRAGVEKDLRDTGEDPVYSVGVGLKTGILRLDYALSIHPTLGETNHFGLALDFNFNPSQVRIERVEARDIFVSLQKTYAREPLGSIRVRNLADHPISARISIMAQDLMDQPTEQDVVLRPRSMQEVSFTAVLSEKVLRKSGDRRVPLTARITYRSSRLQRTEKRSTELVAYGPGAVNWGDGVAQATAFVTAGDPVVSGFAREACRRIALTGPRPLENRNLSFTAAIFDALTTLGVTYVPDPNSPFQTSSLNAGSIDNVHYPRETLAERTGDCDDTSVLLSALLESVGIPTRFVDAPGHLLILAGTGVHERNRIGLGLDEPLTIVIDSQVWIPIETTAISRGFSAAWREGSETCGNLTRRGRLTTVAIAEARARYEPAVLPQPEAGAVPALDEDAQRILVESDSSVVAGWRRDFMNARFGQAASDLEATPEALNEVAHVYYSAGRPGDARRTLEEALGREKQPARCRNNLGNTFAAEGNLRRAIQEYAIALAADSLDAGVWLNLGLVQYAAGDNLPAQTSLSTALDLGGGFEATCALLGIAASETPTRGGGPTMSGEEARELLKVAMLKVPARSDSLTTRAVPDRRKPARPWRHRPAGARSVSPAEQSLCDLLYWKD